MKSDGRADLLMATGHEQVRSTVALDGDWDVAMRVELVLPETGVCTVGGRTAELLTVGGTSAGGCST